MCSSDFFLIVKWEDLKMRYKHLGTSLNFPLGAYVSFIGQGQLSLKSESAM